MVISPPRYSYRNKCISAPVMFSSKSQFKEEMKILKNELNKIKLKKKVTTVTFCLVLLVKLLVLARTCSTLRRNTKRWEVRGEIGMCCISALHQKIHLFA